MEHSNPYKSPSVPELSSAEEVVSAPFEVTVDGYDSFVVDVLSELLKSSAEKAVAARSDPNRLICCRVLSVDPGSTFRRWITFNIFGRPLVEVEVQVFEAEEIIAAFTLMTSTFFLEKKDLHYTSFLGAGTSRVFLATACRRTARAIVERASHHLAISKMESGQMMSNLRDEPMLIFLFGGIVFVGVFMYVTVWHSRFAVDTVAASLMVGFLFGTILGYIFGRVFNRVRRMVARE
ncbi:MAG: hypothetical protein ACI9G1_003444 [Pirellulaceae bacterium]|jgi:hypothetical protein